MAQLFHDFAAPLLQQAQAPLLGEDGGLPLQWARTLEERLEGATTPAERADVELESNTWRLVEALYAERLSDVDRNAFASTSKDPYISPEALVRRLMQADQDLGELQALCAWLEEIADSPSVEPRRGYEPHTKLMLKQAGRIRSSKPPGTVAELDPDAPLREDARLADEDEKYEAALLRSLFELVRAGEIDTALDLCRQSDQSWRAASLSGVRFWKDAGEHDADEDAFDERRSSRGNENRKLWKHAARKLAQNTSLKPYERALYGHLCGEVDAVLPACESWEDEVWAHANALLQGELDRRLGNSQDGRHWQAGPSNVEKRSTASIKAALGEIYERVQESQNAAARTAASHPLRVAQRYLVLGQIDRLFDEFTTRLEQIAGNASEDELARLIRFFAHLALFLRQAGQSLPASSENVLEAYTRVLETHGANALVAYYAAQLKSDEAVETFALYLQRSHPLLQSKDERRAYLLEARRHQLDEADVARRTVELILADAIANEPPAQGDDLIFAHLRPSDLDYELIRSIEWLTFSESTFIDALKQANALTRYFLASGKSSAARETLQSLPTELPHYVAAHSQSSSDPLASLVTEHNDYVLLFQCLQAYAQWSDVWSKRPAKKQSRIAAQPYSESIAAYTTEVSAIVLELLHLKWLHRDEDTLDDVHGMNAVGRLHELSVIRQIYIPELVFRLHRVLVEASAFDSKLLQQAIDMVQIVADERLGLWREFIGTAETGNRLPALLDRAREASLMALGINNSPFLVSSVAK